MALATRFKKTRATKGLSWAEAARELGVAFNTYKYWELGTHLPEPPKYPRVQKWLGISADTLIRELSEAKGRLLKQAV